MRLKRNNPSVLGYSYLHLYIYITYIREYLIFIIRVFFYAVISVYSSHSSPHSITLKIKLAYIGMMVRVFVNGSEDLGSIQGQVIPKTQKMLLDSSSLNTQHYKVWIKGEVEQSRERSSALPYTLL